MCGRAPGVGNTFDFGAVPVTFIAMKEIDALRDLFGAMPEVAVAVLFGSAARGSLTSSSDVDVAVAFKTGPLTSQEKQRLLERLGEHFGRSADVVDLRAQRGRLAARIVREGIPVVVRDTTLWARLLRDAVMWQEDMAALWRVVQRGSLDRLADGR
jgi:predicted nucleotidyltransferase